MKKLITDMIILSPFIAVYEVHNELIAMGVSVHIAFGFMVLTTALMLIAIAMAINTLKNCIKKKCEPEVHR
jgi:hypothetical protein